MKEKGIYEKIFSSNVYKERHSQYKKGKYISLKSNLEFFFDSSWEYIRMKQLDKDEKVVFWFKNEEFVTKYQVKNKVHDYIPDFFILYVDGSIIIEEIKNYEDEYSIAKKEAIQSFCKDNICTYKLLFKKDVLNTIEQKRLQKDFVKKYHGIDFYA